MTHPPRVSRLRPCAHGARAAVLCGLAYSLALTNPDSSQAREISQQRLTPVVIAVRDARAAVVSIRGQKTASATTDAPGGSDAPRHVNGMGTGTIVDERGYILTNYHVVADVRRIEVTLDDGRNYTADLVAYDSAADLAIIKIPAAKPLPTIRFGISADLMEGESVVALGNAFGYEQTVTRGIISALGRDVQVSDVQSYDNLIQTDASINPGNSGGPLLNIDGEMIGVNVAVRAGAQGIGFAIPIDDALQIAARLLNVQRLRSNWHGLVTQAGPELDGPLQVARVEAASPADKIGLQPGDEIVRIGEMTVVRPLDLERALLDQPTGQPLPVEVRRNDQTFTLEIALTESPTGVIAARPGASYDVAQVWEVLGLKLAEEPRSTFMRRNTPYRGGMRVESVRPGSAAAKEGILPGDILVGMHKWETASPQDIQYIISRPTLADMGKLKFFVLRGQNTLYGHINVASTPDTSAQATSRR